MDDASICFRTSWTVCIAHNRLRKENNNKIEEWLDDIVSHLTITPTHLQSPSERPCECIGNSLFTPSSDSIKLIRLAKSCHVCWVPRNVYSICVWLMHPQGTCNSSRCESSAHRFIRTIFIFTTSGVHYRARMANVCTCSIPEFIQIYHFA